MFRRLIALSLGFLFLAKSCQAKKDSQQVILKGLLENYDVNEWPTFNTSGPTEVKVQMFINSFGSLNAANMDYSIDVFLRQTWQDPRLKFNNSGRSVTITNKAMQDKIWKPDTFFNNVKDAEIHRVTMNNILLRVTQTGFVLYSIRMTLKLSCNMDFEYYPFDVQQCDIDLSSYANTEKVIKYRWDELALDLPEELEISEFEILLDNIVKEETAQTFVTGTFSGLKVNFVLRRQYGYHVLQTYVPTILIVSISWVSFWLDPNTVPGRVTLGVTTLLTLTTLASGIRQSLPPVSYVKGIDVWVGTCMIMVFSALLEFTVVNWLANKKIRDPNHIVKIPKILAGSDAAQLDDPSAMPPVTYMVYARAVDRVCRLLFPGCFLLFNFIYWPYYLMELHSDPNEQ